MNLEFRKALVSAGAEAPIGPAPSLVQRLKRIDRRTSFGRLRLSLGHTLNEKTLDDVLIFLNPWIQTISVKQTASPNGMAEHVSLTPSKEFMIRFHGSVQGGILGKSHLRQLKGQRIKKVHGVQSALQTHLSQNLNIKNTLNSTADL